MKMRTVILAALALLFAGGASASWYWPFDSKDKSEKEEPRLSELMEPASLKIDEATDLINDGKTDEAVEKYREALQILERLEAENPERAATPEFQSVRNKRAYVDAQLNAILLEEARVNAKAVAVTDTTDLEEKLRKKRAEAAQRAKPDKKGLAKADKSVPRLENQLDDYMKEARARDKKLNRAAAAARFERESEERIAELLKKDPESRKALVMRASLELYRKNYGAARKDLEVLLGRNPDDISALNVLAAVEVGCGNAKAAEAALMRAIQANRKDYHAYYNLATLLARRRDGGDKARAKRLYDLGRKAGGPEDPKLEKVLK